MTVQTDGKNYLGDRLLMLALLLLLEEGGWAHRDICEMRLQSRQSKRERRDGWKLLRVLISFYLYYYIRLQARRSHWLVVILAHNLFT